MYDKIRQQQPDAIVHCGDLAHTKVNLSPEYFDLASSFLKNLADIAPLIVIPGNHDGNLRNSARQDAITPLTVALAHPNITVLKQSGEHQFNNKVTFNVLSVFDTDNWIKPSDSNKINIALYHGSISGCETSLGWVMEHGENDVSIFEGFDYAMLGDIHKVNQILDDDGRVRYCGSTVQQGFAEELDKGYLLWNIRSKEDFDVELHTFVNPKPFITIELTKTGKIPKKTQVPNGARIRLVANTKLTIESIRKATDVARTRFKPESLTFLNRAGVSLSSVNTEDVTEQNLRDVQVQQELIRDYLKDYNPTEEQLSEVFSLNERFNRTVEANEEVARNVNWSLKELKWDNLFCFGENNKVDFEKTRGLVGIFGKNFSGKSSVVDSLLYTLFNSTSKNVRKNVDIVNDNKQRGSGEVKIQVGTKLYTVERSSEKYEKKLHGQVTTEARTDVKFTVKDLATGDTEILDGTDRNKTDAAIRHTFGTLEDFLLTSMSSQLGALTFISEGSTKRKEILAKFLDLEFFDKKFRLAKAESSDTKGYLRKMESFDFNSDEEEIRAQLYEALEDIARREAKCAAYEADQEELTTELNDVTEKISSIPAIVIDPQKVSDQITSYEMLLDGCDRLIERHNKKIEETSDFISKGKELLETFDEEKLLKDKNACVRLKEELSVILAEKTGFNRDLAYLQKEVEVLEKIPCGDTFKDSCPFISSAFSAKAIIPSTELALSQHNIKEEELSAAIENNDAEHTLAKIESLKTKLLENEHTVSALRLQIAHEEKQKVEVNTKIATLQEKLYYFEENEEAIVNAAELHKRKKIIEREMQTLKGKRQKCQDYLLALHKTEGTLQARLEETQNKKAELEKTRKEYSAYELFMKCMHANGIAFQVIKNKLPVINEAITEVLTNVVDFNVYFEDNGRKLEIFIQHKEQDARPLELGSGAEKTLAAMAIRIALLNVSNMPKSDIFILDEPGTALDANNMEGFTRILDILKEHFKTTLLITHIDGLKDSVQKVITVDKYDGFTHINQ
jgi:DNA repair exonuclease SbcCD ATPase subunit/DNA repair exonuclease SbcCD nuclease subunit